MEQLTKNPNIVLVFEIAQRLMHWWGLVVAGLCLGVGGGFVLYDYLPKQYEASTVLLVTPPRIPAEYVRSTVTIDMGARLQALREAVLSRTYLSTLIEEVIDPDATPLEKEALSGQISHRLSTAVDHDAYRGTGKIMLSYLDSDPQRAADIVNYLANRYIEEHLRLKRNQADTVVETLDVMADNVSEDLESRQRQIAQFKARNLYSLPENRDANMRLLDSSRTALQAKEREIELARNSLELLKTQQRQGRNTSVGTEIVDPAVAQLARAEQELASLLTQYTPAHPRVVKKREEVQGLRAELRARTPVSPGGGKEEVVTPIDAQIVMAERDLERLQREQAQLRDDIDKYQGRLERTPAVEQRLAELSSGLEQLKKSHDRYLTRSEDAKGSRQVEEAQMGEQFEIVEAAFAPSNPVSPNKIRILMISVVGVLGLLLAPIVLKGVLAPRVSSTAGVESLADVPVLITIGEAGTKQVKRQRRRRWAINFASVAGAAIVVVAAVGYLKAWF